MGDASQGDGIFIATNFRDLKLKLSLRNNGSAIVQRYMTKPLLLRGLKFDLRIYVCVGPGLESPVPLALCRAGPAELAQGLLPPHELLAEQALRGLRARRP